MTLLLAIPLAWLIYQQHLTRKELHMSATRADLDAAIDTLVTTINTALTDLQAKIAAGGVTTPEDFTDEITKIQSLTATGTSVDPGNQTAV